MLEIQGISVSYGKRQVLREVSLEVRQGEVVSLIGPNGAGKTSLIRAVSGVVPLQGGRVLANGSDLAGLSPSQRARQVAVVPQARALPEGFTAWQTVALGRTPYLGWVGQTGPKDEARIQWAMQRVEAIDLADRPVAELSGGEQQRILLARALAQETRILLMDEPTAHLDLRHQSRLLSLARDLARQEGLSVLMAMHDLNLAGLYSDRVALLVAGSVRAAGAPAEVLKEELLSEAFRVRLHVSVHPEYGTPLVLPDGKDE